MTALPPTTYVHGAQGIYLDNGVLLNHPDGNHWDLDRWTRRFLAPSSFQPGAMGPDRVVTFRITPGYHSGLTKRSFLEMRVTNSHSGTISLALAPLFIDRIEFGVNGDDSPVHIIHGETLYTQVQFMTQEEINKTSGFGAMNMNPTTYAAASAGLATNASTTYSIPLDLTALDEVFPSNITSDVICRVFFQPQIRYVDGSVGAVGSLILNEARLRFQVIENGPIDAQRALTLSRTPYKINLLNQIRSVRTISLQPGQRTEIKLDVSGPCAGIQFWLRVPGWVQPTADTFFELGGLPAGVGEWNTGINLIDSSGISYLGSGEVSGAVLRGQGMAGLTKGDLSLRQAVYTLWFAEEPQDAFDHGVNSGMIQVSPDDRLVLRPSAVAASALFTPPGFFGANYEITLVFFMYSALMFENGSFRRLY